MLNSIFSPKVFNDSNYSCFVCDSSGNEIYSINPGDVLIPASNQKLYTAIASLIEFGPEYRNSTIVARRGKIIDGELNGDLIFKGYGAINFTARYPYYKSFDEKNLILKNQILDFIKKLKGQGISKINGKLIADNSEWTDLKENELYNAAGPLTFHENTLDILVTGNQISTTPKKYFDFTILAEKFEGEQKRNSDNGKMTDTILINTSKDSRDYWRIEEAKPSEYFLKNMAYQLSENGIIIENKDINPDAEQTSDLFVIKGISVKQIVSDMLLHSDNLRAELLFLNLGYKLLKKANHENSRLAIKQIFEKNNLILDSFEPYDGSGISYNNKISTYDTSKVLLYIKNSKYFEVIKESLPVAGEKGSLINYLNSPILMGKVFAKTGTLDNCKTLSGYLIKNSNVYIFSFFVNNWKDHEKAWSAFQNALVILYKNL